MEESRSKEEMSGRASEEQNPRNAVQPSPADQQVLRRNVGILNKLSITAYN
jgi:hypothetical protein